MTQSEPNTIEGFYLKPYMGTLLIRPDDAPAQTDSGIILPATITKGSSEGLVLATGDGFWSESQGGLVGMGIFAGDRVLYDERSQLKIARNSKDYILISYKFILGITNPSGRILYEAMMEAKAADHKAISNKPSFPGQLPI